jgi:hypothetical protein
LGRPGELGGQAPFGLRPRTQAESVAKLHKLPQRGGSGEPAQGATPGAKGALRSGEVTTAGGVPSGATAVALNATNTRDGSYRTPYPEGATQPLASNLNWTAGETVVQSTSTTTPAALTSSSTRSATLARSRW